MSTPKIRRVVASERRALERFLEDHSDLSMFLRSNLARAGLRDEGERYQGTYVAAWVGPEVVGVAAHYRSNTLLLHAPSASAELAQTAVALTQRPVEGILGPFDQVEAATDGLGLGAAPRQLDSRQVLFGLQLEALIAPTPQAELSARVATREDVPLLTLWRREYDRSLGVEPPLSPPDDAEHERIARSLDERDLWLLEHEGRPVAQMTFNARVPGAVQVGGVFTTPDARGRGFARRVVAHGLTFERRAGTERSILFTDEDNTPARRAYVALGFKAVGEYGIRLFKT